ncbi:hypothetical protein PVK06_000424 [Gossypium arboreum]|uniref:Aminotransferase-like plant mobile domain-containing protein n=1 Tax=Gossypium arboreum TaxID=29729 RepID=A0ABR0QY87_GOSAR|nr:hypothetical protein PVK06_000424 [Gossypium arboreum]
MPNANNNKVHLIYLPALSYLEAACLYSWRSTVLATSYRELCWATKHKAQDINGCLILLQSWVLYNMPFMASMSHQIHVFPLVNRYREVETTHYLSTDD